MGREHEICRTLREVCERQRQKLAQMPETDPMYRPLMMQLLQLEREYLLNQVQYHCLAIDWEQMEKLAFMDASKGAGWSKRVEEEQAIWHQREIERKDPLAVNGEIVEARRAAGYALPTK